MRGCWVLLLPTLAMAQLAPPGVTGILLERDTRAATGELSLRAPDNQVFRFQFDAGTAVQRDGVKINVAALNPGEKIQVASEAVENSLLRSARMILVLVPISPRSHAVQTVELFTHIFPAADLTFAGVVSKFSPQLLVIHGRDGDHTILIRKDTHYLADGGTVEADALRPNMRVYVVAGKDLYERVEAYRIVWGSIFDPGR